MRAVDAERSKWLRVQETAKLFPSDETQDAAVEPPVAQNGSVVPETPDMQSPAQPSVQPERRTYKSLREYPPMLAALFDEESRRIWRTGELLETLADRGLIDRNDPNEPNRVSRALKKLTDDEYIVVVKKGQYLRASPVTDYTLAGDLGFPVPDTLALDTDAGP